LNRDLLGEDGGINLNAILKNEVIRFVDYLGMELVLDSEQAKYPDIQKEFDDALKKLSECPESAALINELKNSKITHTVTFSAAPSSVTEDPKQKASKDKGGGTKINWNTKDIGPECKNCPEVGLIHELQHSVDRQRNTLNRAPNTESGVPNSEEEAVRRENQYRRYREIPERTEYDGKKVSKPSVAPAGPAVPVPSPPSPPKTSLPPSPATPPKP
jgi:hypothetical protein